MAKVKQADAAKLPAGLGDALRELPHIETVYISDDGKSWHFIKRPGFNPIERDDVLEAQPPVAKKEE